MFLLPEHPIISARSSFIPRSSLRLPDLQNWFGEFLFAGLVSSYPSPWARAAVYSSLQKMQTMLLLFEDVGSKALCRSWQGGYPLGGGQRDALPQLAGGREVLIIPIPALERSLGKGLARSVRTQNVQLQKYGMGWLYLSSYLARVSAVVWISQGNFDEVAWIGSIKEPCGSWVCVLG